MAWNGCLDNWIRANGHDNSNYNTRNKTFLIHQTQHQTVKACFSPSPKQANIIRLYFRVVFIVLYVSCLRDGNNLQIICFFKQLPTNDWTSVYLIKVWPFALNPGLAFAIRLAVRFDCFKEIHWEILNGGQRHHSFCCNLKIWLAL